MKRVFYIRWNTLSRKFDTKSFNILPCLEIEYDSCGFYDTGDEWCKELNIRFRFLSVFIIYSLYWQFYKKEKVG